MWWILVYKQNLTHLYEHNNKILELQGSATYEISGIVYKGHVYAIWTICEPAIVK